MFVIRDENLVTISGKRVSSFAGMGNIFGQQSPVYSDTEEEVSIILYIRKHSPQVPVKYRIARNFRR